MSEKRKRFIAGALGFAILLSTAACGQTTEGNNSETSNSAASIIQENEAVSISDGTSESTETTKGDEIMEETTLKAGVMEKLGCRVGCAATLSEIEDEKVWEIITTEFNAFTPGNEMKPDAMFNYSNSVCPGTETVIFNDEEMVVPVLYHDRADTMLDKILAWNEANPDSKISVRGHVLVWHSQTPEWFFHEDYDKEKPYVDKETMNKRLEWYIKSMLTYYTGEDSKYKDLFYGFDVVNVSVSTLTLIIKTKHPRMACF